MRDYIDIIMLMMNIKIIEDKYKEVVITTRGRIEDEKRVKSSF